MSVYENPILRRLEKALNANDAKRCVSIVKDIPSKSNDLKAVAAFIVSRLNELAHSDDESIWHGNRRLAYAGELDNLGAMMQVIRDKQLRTSDFWYAELMDYSLDMDARLAQVLVMFLKTTIEDFDIATTVDARGLPLLHAVVTFMAEGNFEEMFQCFIDNGADPSFRHPEYGDALCLFNYTIDDPQKIVLMFTDAGAQPFGDKPFTRIRNVFASDEVKRYANYQEYIERELKEFHDDHIGDPSSMDIAVKLNNILGVLNSIQASQQASAAVMPEMLQGRAKVAI